MPGQLDKNLKKAVKNIKVSDMTKVKEIEMDPELVKIAKEMGKKIEKKRFGGKIKKMKFGGDPTGNTMSEADMARIRSLMARREQTNEGGNIISDADLKKLREMLKGAATAGIGKMKPQGKAMGGEVMDTTKSMPADMMGGGKVKPMKMKMGGVIPGRGGMFKGIK
jgi:hypothetical protein